MKRARSILISVGILAAIVVVPWLALFGVTPPCVAARTEVDAQLSSDKDVHRAALTTVEEGSPQVCFAIAVRLRAGDRSFIKVVR